MCLLYLIINKTQVQIEKKRKAKHGIEYSLASASDGPCPHGWGLGAHAENGAPPPQIFYCNHCAYKRARAHTHAHTETHETVDINQLKPPDLLSRRAKSIPQRAGYWHYISRPANADQTKHVTGSKKTISADLMLCRVACTCYRRSSVVCLCVCLSLCMSVGHNRKPCKNG